MMSRKMAVLVAASLVWATSPSIAQTGPNPAPPPGQTPPEAPQQNPQSDTIDTSENIFGSDLLFILAAVAAAIALAFLATQIGGGDEPVSP